MAEWLEVHVAEMAAAGITVEDLIHAWQQITEDAALKKKS